MYKFISYILGTALLLSTYVLQAAGDIGAGEQKSNTCAVCHGPNGNSNNPMWPNLAGQHAEYIDKQLRDFQTGARENAQMTPMAAPLSDQDIQDLSVYYAAQTPKPGVADPEQLELGEDLYRSGNFNTGQAACMACHGPNGIGNPAAKYPGLKGQHAVYTAAQLQAFKTETRNNDQNSVMRSVASKMTNAEIEAVANYIQGLH